VKDDLQKTGGKEWAYTRTAYWRTEMKEAIRQLTLIEMSMNNESEKMWENELILRYYPDVCLEEMKMKITKTSVRIAGSSQNLN